MNEPRDFKVLARKTGFLIMVLLVPSALVGYFSGFFFYTGIIPCMPPPGVQVDGIASANVLTWNDLNGNSVQDKEEPPLAWVTIGLENGYTSSITGADGKGSVEEFIPGCVCNCWKGESVKVILPLGYRATTPTTVDMTGKEAAYIFGFQMQDDTQRLTFPGEPDWFQAFINRGIILTAFHYSDFDKSLALTLKSITDQGPERIYTDIFNIIDGLNQSNIALKRVSIFSNITGEIAICEMYDVHKWEGKISYSEILSSHCQHSQQ